MTREPNDLELALQKACSTMHAVVHRTYQSVLDGSNPEKELRLIQSIQEIQNPEIVQGAKIEIINLVK